MSALAFTLLALCLVGPVPAALARADWPLRAPRAALVLWQAIALAAVLSAFSAGIAIASRLFLPGPDGAPTRDIVGEIDRMGWLPYAADAAAHAAEIARRAADQRAALARRAGNEGTGHEGEKTEFQGWFHGLNDGGGSVEGRVTIDTTDG